MPNYEITEETISQLWRKIKDTFATKEEAFVAPDVLHEYYQALGSFGDTSASTTQTIGADITKICVGTENDITNSDIAEPIKDTLDPLNGGIRINKTGWYRVSGSAYIRAASTAQHIGVYIYVCPIIPPKFNTEAKEEIVSTYLPKPTDISNYGSVGTTPKIVYLEEGWGLYLAARCGGTNVTSNGSVYTDNPGTFLLIEKVD